MPFPFTLQRRKPITLGPNHPLRKPILDALRHRVEKDLRQKVLFRVTVLRVLDNEAFAQVEPRTPSDTPIDFKKTHYRTEIEAGVFDGPVCYALLRKQRGAWTCLVHVIGPTDVAWSNWTEKPYSASRQLLFPENP